MCAIGAGYRVTVAGSGEAAIGLAQIDPPDLLVADVVLHGGMDGLELARRLRRGGAALPVIVVSGCQTPARRLAELGPNANGSPVEALTKPFDDEDLVSAAARALGPEAGGGRMPMSASREACVGLRM